MRFFPVQITRMASDRFIGWTELIDENGQPVCFKGTKMVSSIGSTADEALAGVEAKKKLVKY